MRTRAPTYRRIPEAEPAMPPFQPTRRAPSDNDSSFLEPPDRSEHWRLEARATSEQFRPLVFPNPRVQKQKRIVKVQENLKASEDYRVHLERRCRNSAHAQTNENSGIAPLNMPATLDSSSAAPFANA